MSSVFISYRRADCPDAVARLHERLKATLRNRTVFYDHTSMELGAEFPARLRDAVGAAGVVLVCIGPKWLELLKARGSDSVDFVREEISLALDSKKEVIPLLIGGNQQMPSEAEFADFPELLPLIGKNALLVRPDPDFETDSDRLITHLERTGPTDIVGSILGGKYKVQRQIGEGGMGDVYVAEQTNPVKRLVAVKLIKAGMDSKEILARFDAERQALAVMDHPNVCKVLDAGTAPNGRPFFVMEFVKGVPITRFCDDRRLKPRERLDLFMTVCRGIQHAHQKGIIHRDIKPANVLVEMIDGKPVPKVIDFGLAKALGQKLTDKSFVATDYGKWVGTLEYSSPEQAEGRFDIDTLSDVYSLGILLYELLAGSPPFTREELLKASEEEMRRVIREVEPAKPSKRLSSSRNMPSIAANRQLDPPALARILRGDLDWIVLKALDKAPERRYATPMALAEDVERHLTDQPITAGKPSTWRSLSKFARRNRGPVLAGSLVLAALVVGIVGTGYGLYLAEKEAELKQQQSDRADENAREARKSAEREKQRANEALREKYRAETQLTRAEKLVYAKTIQIAQRHWDDGRIGRALESLDSCRWDYRGWEHDYLNSTFNRGFVTLKRHTECVASVSFSPDGKHIVSGSWDQTLKVWDALTGQEQLSLRGNAPVWGVSFSPDGKRIVSASSGPDDAAIKVWDALTGQELLTLKGHTKDFSSVSFSPDGKRIVAGSFNKTIKVWNALTGEEQLDLKGHAGGICSVSFSPDGKRIVSGSKDKMLKVWDSATGEEQLTLEGHLGAVSCVSFSPDGKWIVSGSWDKTLRIWDTLKGLTQLILKGHTGNVRGASFSHDGMRIVSGSDDATLKLWNAATGEEQLSLKGHTGPVFGVQFSADGKRVVSGSDDLTVKVWDAVSGQEQPTLKGHAQVVESVSFSPDGKRIVWGSRDDTLKVWDAVTGKELLALRGNTGAINAVSFSPDSRRILSRIGDNTLKVWDATTGEELLKLKEQTEEGGDASFRLIGKGASFSPDGKRIVSGSGDRTLKVWDATTGVEQFSLKGHKFHINCASFSPDGKRIVSGSSDTTLKVWDAAAGEEQLSLKGHTDGVSSASFSPDGNRIVSGSWDKTMRVWDAATGEEQLTLKGHTGGVSSLSFSPDGKRIVSGGIDGVVRLWDIVTGQEQFILNGHTGDVCSMSISPDGRMIVTGSLDASLKLWDAKTGQEQLPLKGHRGSVCSVSFSPNSKLIVSGSSDATLKVWDAVTGQLQLTQSASFSPDGKRIATWGDDGILKVWNAENGQEQLSLKDSTGNFTSVTFSADGKRIVSGNGRGTLMVWNAESGEEQMSLQSKSGIVTSVSISPDGKQIVSGYWDETVKVWDAVKGKERLTLKGDRGPIVSVSFSPGGKWIESEHHDSTIMRWDAASGTNIGVIDSERKTGNIKSVSFSADSNLALLEDKDGKVVGWNIASGMLQPMIHKTISDGPSNSSANDKLRFSINHGVPRIERLDNRGPDGLTPQQRWDRERLTLWAEWNPTWHAERAVQALEHGQRFAVDFHLRLLADHGSTEMDPEAMRSLAIALCDDRQGKAAAKFFADYIQIERKKVKTDDADFAFALTYVSSWLIKSEQYETAEPYIREAIHIREKIGPGLWSVFSAKALLGRALLGQKKYTDSEPFLLKGYEGMKFREEDIPTQAYGRLPETVDALIALYQAINKPEEVKKWQAEKKRYQKSESPSKGDK